MDFTREIPPQGRMTRTPLHGKIYIVGEAPGKYENRTGVPFCGGSGHILMQALATFGVVRNNIRIANCYWRQPPGNNIDAIPEHKIREDVGKVIKDILDDKPDIVILLGATPCKYFLNDPRISKLRGFFTTSPLLPGIPIMPTYHPAAVMRHYEWHFTMLADLGKAVEGSKNPAQIFQRRELSLATCSTAEEFAARLSQMPDKVVLDIETNPKANALTVVGFATSETEAFNFDFRNKPLVEQAKALEALAPILESKHIIMHNALYEMTWLKSQFGLSILNPDDTMVMHHCLLPEQEKSLSYCCSLWLNDVDAWKELSSQDLLIYNLYDCLFTFRLYNKLLEELKKANLLDFYESHSRKLLEPAAFMSCLGIKVDEERRLELLSDYQAKLEDLAYTCKQLVGYDINLNSPAQLKRLFYHEWHLQPILGKKTKKPSTDSKAIEKLLKLNLAPERRAFLETFQVYKKTASIVSKELQVEPDVDGCIHTGYKIVGTETGRWSASQTAWGTGTNLQNRSKPFRSFFIPHHPDWVFISRDLSGAEARVVAWLINDELLIDAFLNGLDIHKLTASLMFSCSESQVTPQMRKIGKVVRHGANYSMTHVTLAEVLGVTRAEAKDLIEKFHKANPKLREVYFPAIELQIRKNRTLYTPLGRRRIFTGRLTDQKTFREAFSFIPQSTVGDLVALACARFYEATRNRQDGNLVANVHDEIVIECHKDKWEEFNEILKKSMEIPLRIKPLDGSEERTLVIPSDGKMGKNWAPYDAKTNPDGLVDIP